MFASGEVLERVGSLDGVGGPVRLRLAMDVRPTGGGQTLETGPLRLRIFELAHTTTNLGVRVEVDGTVFAYAGDAGPSDAILELTSDADLFVCDASYSTPPQTEGERLLLSALEAGEYARAAGAEALVLTHFLPYDDTALSLATAKKTFG
jgi:ribonuclease BN (tRNA processing enzyme)